MRELTREGILEILCALEEGKFVKNWIERER
jgi:hypothetical protein